MGVQTHPMNILFHLTPQMIERVFDPKDVARLARSNTIFTRDNLSGISEIDVLVTGWSTPSLTDGFLDSARRLKLIAHSAGSTKHLVPPGFWSRGVRLCS